MAKFLSGAVVREGRWFVAHSPELDIASQGRTVEEALCNLEDAVRLYIEEMGRDALRDVGEEAPLVTTIRAHRNSFGRGRSPCLTKPCCGAQAGPGGAPATPPHAHIRNPL